MFCFKNVEIEFDMKPVCFIRILSLFIITLRTTFQTMAEKRKLLAEIEKCFKKVSCLFSSSK